MHERKLSTKLKELIIKLSNYPHAVHMRSSQATWKTHAKRPRRRAVKNNLVKKMKLKKKILTSPFTSHVNVKYNNCIKH